MRLRVRGKHLLDEKDAIKISKQEKPNLSHIFKKMIKMSKPVITVVVDDRERQSGIPAILSDMPGVKMIVQRMSLGDYLLDNRLIFERKTLKDLIYSIIDGRIFSQAARLAYSDYLPIVILEGTSSDIQEFKMKREAMQGALIYISVILRIPVLRSTSPAETADLMLQTARQVQKAADGTVQRHGGAPKGKYRQQMLILQGLPGIGKKRAKQLIKRFKTVENVVNATYEELMDLDGIGKNIADDIRYTLSDKQVLYNVHKHK